MLYSRRDSCLVKKTVYAVPYSKLVIKRFEMNVGSPIFYGFHNYLVDKFYNRGIYGFIFNVFIPLSLDRNNFYFLSGFIHHFLYLEQTVIPGIIERLKRKDNRDIRVWCAGCSSGEEAYTIAMVLAENMGLDFFSAGPPILATDISLSALETAVSGIYSKDRVEIVANPLIRKYFEITEDGRYAVKDNLKKLVTFRRLNLMREHYPFKSKFDFIFCRNVMIYFDKTTKDKLVVRFERVLQDGGYLFIGHSETLGRTIKQFKYVQPAVYIKRTNS